MTLKRRDALMVTLGDERKFVNGIQNVSEGNDQRVDFFTLPRDAGLQTSHARMQRFDVHALDDGAFM